MNRKLYLRWLLYIAKALVMIICTGFVIRGWYISVSKYLSEKTSISVVVNETGRYTYPSITFCKALKNNTKFLEAVMLEASALGTHDLNESYSKVLEKYGLTRRDFLSLFAHPENGDPRLGQHVLDDNSFWTFSIPHPEFSGVCYTYDPKFDSFPAEWFGIRLGIKFNSVPSRDEKEEELEQLQIFLHQRNAFIYYEQDDRPNSVKLDTSTLRYHMEMPIAIGLKSVTRLPTKRHSCETSPEYNFQRCVESFFNRQRGCSVPWNYFPDMTLKQCERVSQIGITSALRSLWDWPRLPTGDLARVTGCKVPCTSTRFIPIVSYRTWTWMRFLDNGADWVIYFWYKNFKFRYEEEFVICDWTCLLGEIGGNLGLFLGGSIFMYLSDVLNPAFSVMTTRT